MRFSTVIIFPDFESRVLYKIRQHETVNFVTLTFKAKFLLKERETSRKFRCGFEIFDFCWVEKMLRFLDKMIKEDVNLHDSFQVGGFSAHFLSNFYNHRPRISQIFFAIYEHKKCRCRVYSSVRWFCAKLNNRKRRSWNEVSLFDYHSFAFRPIEGLYVLFYHRRSLLSAKGVSLMSTIEGSSKESMEKRHYTLKLCVMIFRGGLFILVFQLSSKYFQDVFRDNFTNKNW